MDEGSRFCIIIVGLFVLFSGTTHCRPAWRVVREGRVNRLLEPIMLLRHAERLALDHSVLQF